MLASSHSLWPAGFLITEPPLAPQTLPSPFPHLSGYACLEPRFISPVPNSGQAAFGPSLSQQGELSHEVTWVQSHCDSSVTRCSLMHRARSCIHLQKALTVASPHLLRAHRLCLKQVRYQHSICPPVLVSAGIELIFLIVAGIVLWFGFGMGITLTAP